MVDKKQEPWYYSKPIADFQNNKGTHNVSINLWHEVNTKKHDYFMVDKK